jgi:hypothetical protein
MDQAGSDLPAECLGGATGNGAGILLGQSHAVFSRAATMSRSRRHGMMPPRVAAFMAFCGVPDHETECRPNGSRHKLSSCIAI